MKKYLNRKLLLVVSIGVVLTGCNAESSPHSSSLPPHQDHNVDVIIDGMPAHTVNPPMTDGEIPNPPMTGGEIINPPSYSGDVFAAKKNVPYYELNSVDGQMDALLNPSYNQYRDKQATLDIINKIKYERGLSNADITSLIFKRLGIHPYDIDPNMTEDDLYGLVDNILPLAPQTYNQTVYSIINNYLLYANNPIVLKTIADIDAIKSPSDTQAFIVAMNQVNELIKHFQEFRKYDYMLDKFTESQISNSLSDHEFMSLNMRVLKYEGNHLKEGDLWGIINRGNSITQNNYFTKEMTINGVESNYTEGVGAYLDDVFPKPIQLLPPVDVNELVDGVIESINHEFDANIIPVHYKNSVEKFLSKLEEQKRDGNLDLYAVRSLILKYKSNPIINNIVPIKRLLQHPVVFTCRITQSTSINPEKDLKMVWHSDDESWVNGVVYSPSDSTDYECRNWCTAKARTYATVVYPDSHPFFKVSSSMRLVNN